MQGFMTAARISVGAASGVLLAVMLVVLGIASSACAAEPMSRCPSGLTPSSTVPVELPPRLHNEFEGVALVSFVIGVSGDVLSPSIARSDWRAVGHRNRHPVGYDEAIRASVSRWRYPRRLEACRHQVPVEIRFT